MPTGLGKTACLDIASMVALHLRQSGRLRFAKHRRASGGSSTGGFLSTRQPNTRGLSHSALHEPESLRDSMALIVSVPSKRVAERLRSLWIDPARSPAGRDQPSGRHRLAHSHRSGPTHRHPMHGADVWLPSSVPRVMGPLGGLSTPPWLAPTASFCSTKRTLQAHLRTLLPALDACTPTSRDVLGAKRVHGPRSSL